MQEKVKRLYSNFSVTSSNVHKANIDSMYDRFLSYENGKKKKYFKTKLFSNEKSTCDVCGERLKIGTMSFYSAQYNFRGHPEHITDHINSNYNFPINKVTK